MSRGLNIPISAIAVSPDRLRPLDDDWARLLSISMGEIGLKQPILVAKSGDKYRLVAGLHRLAAAKLLGWPEIPAEIGDGNKLQQRLAEIDENLMRRELSALDRGAFLAERQAIYVELHPETAKGKAGAAARWNATTNLAFAPTVAEKLGLSETSIRRAIRRSELIDPETRARIATTWIANSGTDLDALIRLEPKNQRRAVAAMLREAAPAKSVSAALVELKLAPQPASDDSGFTALASSWRKAKAKGRNAFLEQIYKSGELVRFIETRKARP